MSASSDSPRRALPCLRALYCCRDALLALTSSKSSVLFCRGTRSKEPWELAVASAVKQANRPVQTT